ncbi:MULTISPECIES: helix-turn-helix domain-containing protein [Rhodococcus]|uniref:helix-turn-helix domain-containing protein n=1 Tax=Rhodococcus TaxID=1827 RepID=UPI001E333D5C|nr:helix-turn-helix transcriptional regulator [Rhodococcus pyridinivorans]MCD2117092.1 helix-turn-helix domain-containing protein [Rhodococcus pyridinivorans]MCZ4626066.1 helix-turn-helix transcriptional regulator [Rhodococcus pyridinivorans]MCZ4647168.1 helix-turn-helix transcriptional regulator [Rhodococcus pyridinivorans]MDJ0483573.1 helix-turn-helix transcriptional regulator [Rhodococcus pyridinivorans]MDV7253125.1 helix-turn-helix transcriptional regulator [Rhodococcus pyridinivorans]
MAEAIGAAVRRRRNDLGISAQKLADACTELGYPLPRNSIANLENGRRSEVSVAELIVIARALRVPPLLLLFPGIPGEKVEVAPGVEAFSYDAAEWFSGRAPFSYLSNGDEPYPLMRVNRGDSWGGGMEFLPGETYTRSTDISAWEEGAQSIRLARAEADLWKELRQHERDEQAALMDRDEVLAEAARARIARTRERIAENRREQRAQGLTPIPMPREARYQAIDPATWEESDPATWEES